MTQYTVQYFNGKSCMWFTYLVTFDKKNAADSHSDLLNRGYRASISQAHVSEK